MCSCGALLWLLPLQCCGAASVSMLKWDKLALAAALCSCRRSASLMSLFYVYCDSYGTVEKQLDKRKNCFYPSQMIVSICWVA